MAKKSTTPAKKRATEALATGNDSRERILVRVAKVGQRLDSYMQKLTSIDPNNGKLSTAFGYWGMYPTWKEIVDSDLRQTSDEVVRSQLYGLQYKMNHVHEAATDVLMKRAEEIGIESDTIWQSAKYCRDLLANKLGKYYPPNREDDRWPGCLGESLYELPPDIRQAIQDGHAQVLRLSIKRTKPPTEHDDAPSKKTPVVTLGNNPQIELDGKAIALKYETAVYLKTLIACGDWMSDPEYKAKHGSENDRPERWRKQLPPEVLARIETNIRKGSRWRLA